MMRPMPRSRLQPVVMGPAFAGTTSREQAKEKQAENQAAFVDRSRNRSFQEFKRLPIPDGRDAAFGHGLHQTDPTIVTGVTEATGEHRIAKAQHQRKTVVLDAVAERIVGYAEFDEAVVVGA